MFLCRWFLYHIVTSYVILNVILSVDVFVKTFRYLTQTMNDTKFPLAFHCHVRRRESLPKVWNWTILRLN